MHFIIYTLLFASICFATSATLEGCTKVENTYYDRQGPITVSATFSVDSDPRYVMINNISIDYGNKNFSNAVCVVPDFGDILCLSDFANKTLRFPAQNETLTSLFYIDASVYNTKRSNEFYNYTLFSHVLDEGYLSLDSGEIFNKSHFCFGYSSYDRHGKLQSSLSQCCSEFNKPIPEISTKNLTSCKNFKSRTTVYNVDDNYSIFATTQANYSLLGNNLTIHGESVGPDDLNIWVSLNTFGSFYVSQNITSGTCSFKIQDEDSKFIINAIYENSTIPVDFDDIIQEHRIITGRVIFRNGIPLMAESDPFTPQNNCQYFNADFSPNQVASSSFCCTEF